MAGLGRFGVIAALVVATGTGHADGGRYAAPRQRVAVRPVDQGGDDPSFAAFRSALRAIVRRKDAAALDKVLDREVVSDFGAEENTPRDFKQRWRPEAPDSEVWRLLANLLAMGGGFVPSRGPTTFCAPYVFTAFPRDVDGFEYVAVTGSGVVLRADPWPDAAPKATLYYDIVRPISDAPVKSRGTDWMKVELPPGIKGWLPADSYRSPIDYRVCFVKRRSGWRLSALVSGD